MAASIVETTLFETVSTDEQTATFIGLMPSALATIIAFLSISIFSSRVGAGTIPPSVMIMSFLYVLVPIRPTCESTLLFARPFSLSRMALRSIGVPTRPFIIISAFPFLISSTATFGETVGSGWWIIGHGISILS